MNSNFRYFNWRLSPEEIKEDFFVRYFLVLHYESLQQNHLVIFLSNKKKKKERISEKTNCIWIENCSCTCIYRKIFVY
jgi:hypothetical protein